MDEKVKNSLVKSNLSITSLPNPLPLFPIPTGVGLRSLIAASGPSFTIVPDPGVVQLGNIEYVCDTDQRVSQQLKVGVVCSGWPFWAFAASAAGMTVDWIHGTTPEAIRLARCTDYNTINDLTGGATVDVLLLDHGVWKTSRPLISVLRARCIIIEGVSRRSGLSATIRPSFFRISHAQTAGVSNSVLPYCVFSVSDAFGQFVRRLKIPDYPQVRLSSILSCTVEDGKATTRATPGKGVHGPGDLFSLVDGSAVVHANCVTQYPRFRERELTLKERASVLDLPSGYGETLASKAPVLLRRLAVPLKPSSVLLQHLFFFVPGGEVFPLPLENYNFRSLLTNGKWCDDVHAFSTGAAEKVVDVNELAEEVDEAVTIAPVLESISEPRVNGHTGNHSAKSILSAPATVGKISLPACAISEEIERGSTEVAGPEMDQIIPQQVEKDANRNATAAKADDAAVPVHIWRYHLFRILNREVPHDWEIHADRLRAILLPCYRRMQFRSFLLWRRDTYKKLRPGLRWIRKLMWWKPTKAKFRFKQAERTVVWDVASGSYLWTGDGLQTYQKQWKTNIQVEPKDCEAMRDVCTRVGDATWWEWTGGSRIMFWKWDEKRLGNYACVKEARDGVKIMMDRSKLPRNMVGQREPRIPEDKPKVKKKLEKFLNRRYLVKNQLVKSLISFFYVGKGEFDIRVVFNGTSCGLNDALHAPWFPLPTVESHLRSVVEGTWLADEDLGEMFYNFCLDQNVRAYTGVDMGVYFEDVEEGKRLWAAWTRLIMGLKPSPYISTHQLLRADTYLVGDRRDKSNPFQWKKVVFNLPGMENYNPSLPRVYKVRWDGRIASDKHTYIDDLRLAAYCEAELWRVCQQVASRLNFLGLQHAARKLRELMQDAGAWAGAVVHTSTGVYLLVSMARWEKTKFIIESLQHEMRVHKSFHFKDLESWRGYLIYVTRTYTAMKPYLKGLHQTLDSWREYRGEDGWKLSYRDINLLRRNEEETLGGLGTGEGVGSGVTRSTKVQEPPERVKPAQRMADDLNALEELCKADEPPKRMVRPRHAWAVAYGFGDASGGGGGSGIEYRKKLRLRFCVWCSEISEQSSNYREFLNLVMGLEAEHREGRLDGVEIFLFTDNMVAEGAYYKGSAKTKHLHGLVLRLRKLEMEGNMILHVIHVAGTRMIRSGIDGLSRGDTHEGVAVGRNMLSYVALHLSPDQRSDKVLGWVKSWFPSRNCGKLEVLTPDDWFLQDREKKFENCLWFVPPGAGDVAVEMMASWRHAVPGDHIHVMIIPRQWTVQFRKYLGKASDWSYEIPLNVLSCWDKTQHEPLLIGISFPKFNRAPYEVKQHKIVDVLEKQLQGMRKDPSETRFRNLLLKFCREAWSLSRV